MAISIAEFVAAVNAGTASSLYPVGTEIDDVWEGVAAPLIVAHYLDSSNNANYGGAIGAFLFRKYLSPISYRWTETTHYETYEQSMVYASLKTTYWESTSPELKEAISEVQVPSGNYADRKLIPVKWFLMSADEVNYQIQFTAESWDGEVWQYWKGADRDKRVATPLSGSAAMYTLRSQDLNKNNYCVTATGGVSMGDWYLRSDPIRPACFVAKEEKEIFDYSVTFEDADYGCGSPSQIVGDFNIAPVAFEHSDSDPEAAVVTFEYTNQLTLKNVKYSTTTDQDVSSWLVYSTSQEALGSTNKTFVPREDCAKTSNRLSDTFQVTIKDDKFVQLGARWSGFDDNPDGLPMGELEWFKYELSRDYTISPPQNLQVTFPQTLDGVIDARILQWSDNPWGIGPGSMAGYWDWRVELLDRNGNVVTTRDYEWGSVVIQHAQADLSKALHNSVYRIRVTAQNEYKRTVSVTSPEIPLGPPTPIIQDVEVGPDDMGMGMMCRIWWLTPRSAVGVQTREYFYIPGYYEKAWPMGYDNGGLGGQYNTMITDINIPPGTEFEAVIEFENDYGTSKAVWKAVAPAATPTISIDWDERRKCALIGATSSGSSITYDMTAGYTIHDSSLGETKSGSSLSVCDLEHGDGQILYVTATPKIGDEPQPGAMGQYTVKIPNPILGIAKTCDNTANIIDIVESKEGEVTKRWQTGDRVKLIEPCKGGAINWLGEKDCNSSYTIAVKEPKWNITLEDGWLRFDEGLTYKGGSTYNNCIYPVKVSDTAFGTRSYVNHCSITIKDHVWEDFVDTISWLDIRLCNLDNTADTQTVFQLRPGITSFGHTVTPTMRTFLYKDRNYGILIGVSAKSGGDTWSTLPMPLSGKSIKLRFWYE